MINNMATYECEMSFLEPWPSRDEKEPPYVRGITEDGYPQQNFKNIEHTIQVTDARPNKEAFSLDKNGFAWYTDTSLSPEVLRAIRSKDKDLVAEAYYPIVDSIIQKATGATEIIIFDHTYRKRDPMLDLRANPNGREQPATVVSYECRGLEDDHHTDQYQVHCDQYAS